ncbi:MAG: alpha/beta hydrolase [Gemmatimonadota bacterium]|nr:alpha/beta hydrolase [Gemmatimonadota bacterium]
MPVISVAGRAVHTVEVGGGEPLVLLHGLGTNLASMWLSLARPLSKSHRVLLYDHRGHGLSEPAESGYDLATLARDLDELLDHLDPDGPLDMAGYSYGGAVLLRHLIDRPGRVRRAILLDPPLPPYDPEDDLLALGRAWDVPEAAVAHLLGPDRAAFSDAAEGLLAALAPGRRSRRSRGVHWSSPAEARFETTLVEDLEASPAFDPDELASVRVPVLVLSCADSSFRSEHEELVEALPDARLRVLEGDHYAPLSRPAPFATAIEAFLDG